jgi:mannose-1-phosphate guanylyltransferase
MYNRGGQLLRFEDVIMEDSPKQIFLMHADICSDFPLRDMLEFHTRHGKILTMMGTYVTKKISQCYGCLTIDENTKELLRFNEKPETYLSNLINCGVYILKAKEFFAYENFKEIR